MLQEFDERNRDLIIGVAGRLVPRDQAGICLLYTSPSPRD